MKQLGNSKIKATYKWKNKLIIIKFKISEKYKPAVNQLRYIKLQKIIEKRIAKTKLLKKSF